MHGQNDTDSTDWGAIIAQMLAEAPTELAVEPTTPIPATTPIVMPAADGPTIAEVAVDDTDAETDNPDVAVAVTGNDAWFDWEPTRTQPDFFWLWPIGGMLVVMIGIAAYWISANAEMLIANWLALPDQTRLKTLFFSPVVLIIVIALVSLINGVRCKSNTD